MPQAAIRIRQIGKQYQIGARARGYTTFREALTRAATSPWRRFRRLAGKASEAEKFWALRDISFDVQEGEVVGIIGRNGAGKSTLLKILSQITEPTEGEIELHGRVGSLLEVGTGFHPELTGRENIYLNGAILGMKRHEIQRRFDEIVAFAEIEKFLDTPVKHYSSGMYMRLAFAVAAHLEPEVLIVDEVLAVGDTAFQEKCLGKMNQVSLSGRTVLFVSHNMAAVESLCTRGIVLDQGRMVFDGHQTEAVRFYFDTSRQAEVLGQYRATDRAMANGRQTMQIAGARMTSGGKDCGGSFAIGAPLEFTIDIEAADEVLRPEIGIGINNSKGLRVVTLHTRCDPALSVQHLAGTRFRAVCRVPELALAPGKYSVTLALLQEHRFLEHLENVMTFDVLPTDFFGNAGNYWPGVIMCKQAWQMEKNESAWQRLTTTTAKGQSDAT